jgi:hypothetical protein
MVNVRVGASERRWRTQEAPVDTEGYVLVGRTNSNLSEWAFNRLRMYENSTTAEVQLRWKDTLDVIDTQPFHTGGGWTVGVAGSWEHDFTFDLSMNTNNDEIDIMMRGLATNPQAYTEAYFYDTGFSASRPIFSSITYWDFNYFNPINDGYSSHGYFLAKNNPLSTLLGAELTGVINMQIENCNLDSATIDKLMIALDQTGYSGGTFTYIGNPGAPTAAVKPNYDNLVAKNWNLTGLAPPGDYPSVTSYYKLNETYGTSYADAVGGNTATKRGGSVGTGIFDSGYQGATAAGNDIVIPYIPAYDLVDTDGTLKPHTIAFWFKTTNNALTWQMLAQKTSLFYIALYNGTLRWVITNGSNGNLERRSYQFSFYNNTWYCCALAYDGTDGVGGLKMYINGTHVDRSSTVGTSYGNASTNTNDIVLANHANGSNAFGLNGVIDEVVISIGDCWDVSDAATYYNNGNGTPYTVNNTTFSSVNDLSVDEQYATGVKLTFTPPTSDYAIDRYELTVDGVLELTFNTVDDAILGNLTPNTTYNNVSIVAFDIYGNANSSSNVISFTTSTTASLPTSGLQAYYKFESSGSVLDSHGANDGTNYGATTVVGKNGNGYSYDGADDYSIIPSSYFSGDVSWSMSMWLNINGLKASRSGILVIRPQNTGGMHILLNSNGTLLIGRWNGGATTVTPPISTLFNLTVTFDKPSRELKIYIDGTFTKSTTLTGSQLFSFNGDIIIGDGVSSELNYDGIIDELPIYNRALNAAEVSEIYNEGNGLTYP